MIKHTMPYNWEKIPPFLGFDIYNIEKGKFLDYKYKKTLFNLLFLETSKITAKITMKEKLICPICNKEYTYALKTWQDNEKKWHCSHDDISKHDKERIKRHRNYDESNMALKLAAEAKDRDNQTGEGKMVTVKSNQDGSAGKVEQVPEKVIKSIEEKVGSELQE